jgi:hypothetical protein
MFVAKSNTLVHERSRTVPSKIVGIVVISRRTLLHLSFVLLLVHIAISGILISTSKGVSRMRQLSDCNLSISVWKFDILVSFCRLVRRILFDECFFLKKWNEQRMILKTKKQKKIWARTFSSGCFPSSIAMRCERRAMREAVNSLSCCDFAHLSRHSSIVIGIRET